MRLGIDTSDEFIKNLSEKSNEIQTAYSKKMEKLTSHVSIKAMLGDSTITQTKTFDPMQIQNFYKNISENLQNWNIRDVTMTNNEDIRRIFIKFDSQVGNYLLSGHMSIQFHVLLYYKQDNKVIQYQKELSEIIDRTKTMDSKLGDDSDQFILQKLKELGYTDLNHQNLFEVFFENDKLREKIYEEIEKNTDLDFKKLAKRKMDLFNELDSLLIETYQTSNVLIDDTRLIAGEEGYLCNFDLEFIKNKVKEGKFVPKKIPNDVKENLIKKLDEIKKIIEI
ncbi:MAG: hypothetical protein NPMRd3_360001 [Nitrosopumilales archaeon]|nr:MAG: hypothetical protein NPMRd3_360001 [Nitrosopumilales archaeon]